MNRLLLTLGALLILLSACKKEDSPVTAEEDLRTGMWRRTSGKETYKDPLTRGDSTRDYYTDQPDCRKDNMLTFKVNDVGVLDLGTLRCTAGEADTKTFTWQVTQDGKRISLYGVSDYFPANDIDADIITRTLGYLTIRYRVITTDAIFQTADTIIYTDVLRRN
jgi:hypothetical protein